MKQTRQNERDLADPGFSGRPILVLGAGRSGLAVTRLLHSCGAQVTLVDDHKPVDEVTAALGVPDVNVVSSGYRPGKLVADALVLSPGVPDSHPLAASFQERG
ncbi:MAG: hypothetical protein V3U35_01635, partial [Candidatus Neomarinimicrobiota bacterium]